MKKIVVINGHPKSGKTFIGSRFASYFQFAHSYNVVFHHISSITPIKDALLPENEHDSLLYGEEKLGEGTYRWLRELKEQIVQEDWPGESCKDDYWRSIMSQFKALILSHNPDFINDWILRSASMLENRNPEKDVVLFVDIREPHNIESLRERIDGFANGLGFEFATMFIKADVVKVETNPSDAAVEEIQYDIVFDNIDPGNAEEREDKTYKEIKRIVECLFPMFLTSIKNR